MKWRRIIWSSLILGLWASCSEAQVRRSLQRKDDPGTYDIVTDVLRLQAKNFVPKRTKPAFEGVFSVGLVLIRFPDTIEYDMEHTLDRFNRIGSMSIEEYYKDYSQGITWPKLVVVGGEKFPASVYVAPQPLGYYCRHDTWNNPLGFRGDEGNVRVGQLKRDALAHAMRSHKRIPGVPSKMDGTPQVIAYVYECARLPKDQLEPLIKPRYPKGQKVPYDHKRDAWELYSPEIPWADPLWPNSAVQIHNTGDGGTLVHELGHVLGAPDYYHASEPHDGVGGTPCLPWDFGPTGPGYCRVIYQAFLPPTAYPMVSKEGEYSLAPRKTNPAEDKTLGIFIPSAHPNYLFCLEYVKEETPPLGQAHASGLLIQVINVTLPGPFMGPPDLCYAYRPDDPWLQGEGNLRDALFGDGNGRPRFDMQSDPPARLPNLLDSGIALENIKENSDDTLSFDLKITQPPISGMALKESLLPKIALDEVDEILPNSARAKATVRYRGEPLKNEYGFCWNTMAHPTYVAGKVFPLYHRDRYEGRILGLRPNTTYYMRAYVRSPLGISYSTNEISFKTPAMTPLPASVQPLLKDKFSNNWTMERWHGGQRNDAHVVGTCAMTGLLKLSNYYRAPLDASVHRPTFDYTRIHTSPSLSRPEFRMVEYNRAMNEAKDLAWKAKLCDKVFAPDFERVIKRVFGIRTTMGVPFCEELTLGTMVKLAPLIRAQVAASQPVMVVQESLQPMTPTEFALMMVLIDGYNDDEFHLVFPTGRDRDKKARTGWHSLEALFEEVNTVKVIFGLKAPKVML